MTKEKAIEHNERIDARKIALYIPLAVFNLFSLHLLPPRLRARIFITLPLESAKAPAGHLPQPPPEIQEALEGIELEISQRFDALPGKCQRKIERMRRPPSSWGQLLSFVAEHEKAGHRH